MILYICLSRNGLQRTSFHWSFIYTSVLHKGCNLRLLVHETVINGSQRMTYNILKINLFNSTKVEQRLQDLLSTV